VRPSLLGDIMLAMSDPETIVAGVGLIEGPVWRDAQGDLIITVVGSGRLHRVDVDAGTAEIFADTAGGPNGAYPCDDGGVVVTQNGGLDWDAIGIPNPDPSALTTPGLQRVYPDGRVELLTAGDGPFRAPNDLCIGPDGAVWFTDPPQFPPPAEPVGRVWRWSPGGPAVLVADGFSYCNGIGVTADGTVLVVEGRGLMCVADRSWFVETLPSGGDGFAFDVEGNVYIAGGTAITVVSPAGEVVEQLEAPSGPAMTTNCCFGGPDRQTLYVTEGLGGRVLAFPGMPVAGVPMAPLSV
jgi:gluconolactonase